MERISFVARSFAAVGLLLGLFVSLTAPSASAQADADDVDLTIHVLTCPTDAEGDIFQACHDNRVKNATFDVAGTKVKGDKDGVVTATVAGGSVVLDETDFDTIATAGRAVVYCSPQPAGKPLTEDKTTNGKVTIKVEAGTEVHCDWYNRTGASDSSDVAKSITIHALDCPADSVGNIFDACHDNRLEGVDYSIGDLTVTSDQDGVAMVRDVPAGKVTIREINFDNLATAGRAFVYCSIQPDGEPVLTSVTTRNGRVTFDVPADAEIHCDWYNRISAAGPTPTIAPTETPEPTVTPQPTETPDSGNGGSGGGQSATATATATPQIVLPTTGAGPTNGSSGAGFAFGLLLVVLTVVATSFGLRRRSRTDA